MGTREQTTRPELSHSCMPTRSLHTRPCDHTKFVTNEQRANTGTVELVCMCDKTKADVFSHTMPWHTVTDYQFLPAWHYASASTIAPCPPVSVGALSKQINESDWFLACELLSTVTKKFWYSQKWAYFLWNFVPNSRFKKFCHDQSIVKMCQLSLTHRNAQSMIKCAVVGQLSRQYHQALMLDCCSLSQWSSCGSISSSRYMLAICYRRAMIMKVHKLHTLTEAR